MSCYVITTTADPGGSWRLWPHELVGQELDKLYLHILSSSWIDPPLAPKLEPPLIESIFLQRRMLHVFSAPRKSYNFICGNTRQHYNSINNFWFEHLFSLARNILIVLILFIIRVFKYQLLLRDTKKCLVIIAMQNFLYFASKWVIIIPIQVYFISNFWFQ